MTASVIQDALGFLRDQSVAEAIDCLESAVVATPAYPAAYVLLARAYESQKNWHAARSAWDQAFVLMPHSPIVQEGRERVHTLLRSRRRSPDTATDSPDNPLPQDTRTTDVPPEDSASKDSPSTPTDEDPPVPSLSMDDGPADLDALRAQTEQASQQQTSSPGPDALNAALGDSGDDLDDLIEALQSAHIRPDPDIDDVPTPELEDDIEDMVSETLARIYASQGAHHEAARVYVQLAVQEPERSQELLREASKMRQKARGDSGDPADSADA